MKTIIKIIVIAISLIAFQSCTDHFEELNTNPHAYTDLDPGIQLAKVQLDLSGNRGPIWEYDLGIAMSTMQYFSGSWWCQHGGQYNIVNKSHWAALWEDRFSGGLKNIQNLLERTEGVAGQENMNSVARIMRVYLFSELTDMYGDIPYSQAIKGFSEGILLPTYDKQEDIYTDFFIELEKANVQLTGASGTIKGDLLLDGDVNKWRKFANSLRMRLGFRLTKVNPTEAKTQVEAAISGGVMTSNDDISMMIHEDIDYQQGDIENRGNGRSQTFQASANSEGFRLTNTFVDHLKLTGDPRLFIYGGTYLEDGTDLTQYLQLGITHGAMWWNEWSAYGDLFDPNTGNLVANVPMISKHMQPSKYIADQAAPNFVMTYAEVELLLAEAAVRGWGATGAQAHYEAGLQAGLTHVSMYPGAPDISQADKDAFIAANALPADMEGKIRVINEQMWVNLYMNGLESYSNFRRSGYPALTPFQGVEWYTSGTGGVIPRRFFYPEFESQVNPVNYQEAVDRQGADDLLTRVWWDKE
ncbi:MAG: SusD/RagB family nutrient-binding outer membrane lipoprotein [Flavobacteriaceae bacterium]